MTRRRIKRKNVNPLPALFLLAAVIVGGVLLLTDLTIPKGEPSWEQVERERSQEKMDKAWEALGRLQDR